jgi:hypothetical protein
VTYTDHILNTICVRVKASRATPEETLESTN